MWCNCLWSPQQSFHTHPILESYMLAKGREDSNRFLETEPRSWNSQKWIISAFGWLIYEPLWQSATEVKTVKKKQMYTEYIHYIT